MEKDSRTKYLLKNTIIFALGNFGTKIISFFLVPLYTYVLSSSKYGTVDLISTITMVLAPVIVLNISEAVMRFSLDDDADQAGISSIGISCLLFGVVIGLLIIPIGKMLKTISPYTSYIYLYTVSLASSQFFLCELRGKEILLGYSLGNIINTFLIALLNIIFLVIFKLGIKGYLLAYILANFITSIYALILSDTINDLINFHINKELCLEMIKYSIVLVPNTFMWWIMNSSDRMMVTAMISASANGIYAISYKIPTLLSTISSVFNQAWGYSAIKEDDSEDRDEFNNRVFNTLAALMITSGTIMMAIIKPFLKIYVSNEYYKSWEYTPYLIIGCVYLTLATFLATQYTVQKDSKGYLYSATIGALLNIVLNYCLIPIIGISGAALATCLSYISVFIYRFIDTKKYISIDIFNKEFCFGSLMLILSGLTIFVKNVVGFILLLIEVAFVLMLYKKYWGYLINKCKTKLLISKKF